MVISTNTTLRAQTVDYIVTIPMTNINIVDNFAVIRDITVTRVIVPRQFLKATVAVHRYNMQSRQ